MEKIDAWYIEDGIDSFETNYFRHLEQRHKELDSEAQYSLELIDLMKRTSLALKDIDGTYGEYGEISARQIAAILEYSTDIPMLERKLHNRIVYLEKRLSNPTLFNQTLLDNIKIYTTKLSEETGSNFPQSTKQEIKGSPFEQYKEETSIRTRDLMALIDTLDMEALLRLQKDNSPFGEYSSILLDDSTRSIVHNRIDINLELRKKSIHYLEENPSQATEIKKDVDKMRIVIRSGIYEALKEKLIETNNYTDNQVCRILIDLGIVDGEIKSVARAMGKLLKNDTKLDTEESTIKLRNLKLLK